MHEVPPTIVLIRGNTRNAMAAGKSANTSGNALASAEIESASAINALITADATLTSITTTQ